jgi:uncharacterized membrane protein
VSDVPPPVPPPPPGPPPGGFGVPAPTGGPTAGNAISYGWKKFQEQIGVILGVIAIPFVAQLLISGVGGFAAGNSIPLRLVLQLVSIIISGVAAYGIFNASLMITAGQPLDISKAFQNDRWVEWLVFSFVFNLMIGVGLLLCIIPGLFLLSIFALAPYFFIDRRMNMGDALSASQQAMKQTKIGAPVVLTIAFSLLGLLACCVGVLVTEAIAYIGVAMFYRYATNQPVAP